MLSDNIRIGVFICDCGSNIAGIVDTEDLREYSETLPGVVAAIRNKYTCADPGQQEIQRSISEYNLNRVVVASCSPLHMNQFSEPASKVQVSIRTYLKWRIYESIVLGSHLAILK